ncbi:hypothetical protein [Elongatibacter sediminis]|uniref:EthD domain-containing protein n=1 Tax=Elongatibacter sediminis TaxID=3119006 RepID=A0AAW9R996_9GAMM
MHTVSIRYPRKPGESFDFQHWAKVHMPLGIATYEQNNELMPVRVMVQHDTFGMDGKPESADCYITVWLVFDTAEGLAGFMRLHNDAERSADLERDFDNYTPLPPHIVLGELTVFEDMNEVLRTGQALLQSRAAGED